jgi:hypothetical protein
MNNQFPDPNHPLYQAAMVRLAMKVLADSEREPELPQEPRAHRGKEWVQRVIRSLGALLVRVGSKMERVGLASQESVAQ